MSKIGIVILNYNDYEETTNYINQIKDYRVLDEIVIVDNCSTDNSFNKLGKLKDKKVSVIKTYYNNGYASGNNYGVKYLEDRVDYIIISNPDIVVSEDTIIKLKKDLDENEDISVIAPVINQHGEISRGWKLPRVIDEIGLNVNYFHRYVEKNLKYNNSRYNSELSKVDVVSGCFFMIRREILNLVGNFDESTFLFYEENILSSKLKNCNRKVFVDNEVEVIHNESITIDKSLASIKKYKVLKDSQKYFVKYYLHANIFEMFALRLVYYISLLIAYIIYFFNKMFKKKK